MPVLLIVHHSPGPALNAMLAKLVAGATTAGIEGVESHVVEALNATASHVRAADGIILGTPANLGYMSGALKHFFDTAYNACLGTTEALPYGVFVHGESDTSGALLGVKKIATGLRWRLAQPPVSCIGTPEQTALEACWELGAAMAAGLMV
jgi:multimeric flavodoxin WrbA